jgi:hypothetical protein
MLVSVHTRGSKEREKDKDEGALCPNASSPYEYVQKLLVQTDLSSLD